jgi:hypothetical protein
MNDMTDWESVSWHPSELQLVESRKLSNGELELIFGMPLGFLGGFSSNRQYSNVEMDAVNVLKFTVRGPLTRFEQTLSLAYPNRTQVRADLDIVLQADMMSRFKAWNMALDPNKGWMERNEVRTEERLKPLPPKRPVAPALPAGPNATQPSNGDGTQDEEGSNASNGSAQGDGRARYGHWVSGSAVNGNGHVAVNGHGHGHH